MQNELGALIFDMDGTMVENMQCHAECWTALLRDRGLDVAVDYYWKHEPGGTAEEVVRLFLGDKLSDSEAACLVQQKEFLYRTLYRKKIKPVKGLRRLLKAAKKAGMPMAIATSAGKRNIDFTVDALGIRDCFGAIVGAEDVERGKPAPDLYLLASTRLGVDKNRCLIFEDSQAGFEGARRAGMPAVAVATVHDRKKLSKEPGVIAAVRDYSELTLPILRKLFAAR